MWQKVTTLMVEERWYPTVLQWSSAVQASERMIVADGNNGDRYEAFVPAGIPGQEWATWGVAANRLFDGPNASTGLSRLFFYPRLHQLSNGAIFRSGMNIDGCIAYHSDGAGVAQSAPWPVWQPRGITSSDPGLLQRQYGAAVLFPNIDARHTDAVMAIGGYGNGTHRASVEICKPTATASGAFDGPDQGWDWTALQPMHHARANHNAVILPDASVIALGERETRHQRS